MKELRPCTRCGYCCASCTCPVGMEAYKVSIHDPCPGFRIGENGQSECEIIRRAIATGGEFKRLTFALIGVGEGCTSGGTVMTNIGNGYMVQDWEALTPQEKREHAVRVFNRTCRFVPVITIRCAICNREFQDCHLFKQDGQLICARCLAESNVCKRESVTT